MDVVINDYLAGAVGGENMEHALYQRNVVFSSLKMMIMHFWNFGNLKVLENVNLLEVNREI